MIEAVMSEDILCDVLEPGLDVVFVGMASARWGRHYAGPGNKFWPTLAAIGLTPEPLTPDRERELLRVRLGLTDVQKRQAGPDAQIRVEPEDLERLRAKLRASQPRRVAFNGKRAAAYWLGRSTTSLSYGPARDPHGLVPELFVLPSTSRAASGSWNVQPWAELAAQVARDHSAQGGPVE
jgi:TDG/mug DNA glycosylase family protein